MFKDIHFKKHARDLIHLGLPILLGQLAQMSMNFVDTVVAGKAGTAHMAGVSIGGALWTPLLLFGQGILIPIGPLVAQGIGAGKKESLNRFWRQGVWLALFVSVFLILLFTAASYAFLHTDKIDREMAVIASDYLFYIKWGMPAFLLFFVTRFFVEAKSYTRPAMIAGFIGLFCNIPLNYIFAFGYFGMPALGGAGCGLATAAVCWIMFLTMLFYLKKHSPATAKFHRPNFVIMKRVGRLGLPVAFALLLEVSSFSLISLLISPLGKITVSGHQVAMTTSALIFMFPLSLGTATSILVGKYLGAGDLKQAKQNRQTSMLMAFMVACISLTCLFVFRVQIAELYSDDPMVIALAASIIVYTAIYQIPDNVQMSVLSALRGYNDTKAIFCISCFSYWIMSVPVGYALCYTEILGKPLGVYGFWIGLIVGLTSSCILVNLRIRHLERLTPEQIKAKLSK